MLRPSARPALIAIFALAAAASAQPCTPSWSPDFGPGDFDVAPSRLAVFDEGAGPRLFLGGSFTRAGGTDGIRSVARWNGADWEAVGQGPGCTAISLFVAPVKGAPRLWAAGTAPPAGPGLPSTVGVETWDGTDWSVVPSPSPQLYSLSVMAPLNLGGSDAVFAAGPSSYPGSGAPARVLRLEGGTWTQVGSEFGVPAGSFYTPNVNSIETHDDGSGRLLYAAGAFSRIDGELRLRVARWNGVQWESVGEGLGNSPFDSVGRLVSFDPDGPGPAVSYLYAAGMFSISGTATLKGVAQWDGAAWSALPSEPFELGGSITPLKGPGPPTLIFGVRVPEGTRLLRWDGQAFSPLTDATPYSFGDPWNFDDGSGLAMFAVGRMLVNNALNSDGVLRLRDDTWESVDSGNIDRGLGSIAQRLYRWDPDAGGPQPAKVLVGGNVSTAGALTVRGVPVWDGREWSAMDGNLSGSSTFDDFEEFDPGDGQSLFGTGLLRFSGGFSSLARWGGSAWQSVVPLTGENPWALHRHGSGRGSLYVSGLFTSVAGVEARSIIRWDGQTWSQLGSGLGGGSSIGRDMATYPLGSENLYVTGSFTSAGGVAASGIARWNGSQWFPVGSGLAGGFADGPQRLLVCDLGSGSRLIVAGSFTTAGGGAANGIAQWNGVQWSAVGASPATRFSDVTFMNDGSGPALYVVNNSTPPSFPGNIAMFRNQVWSQLGTGLDGEAHAVLATDLDGPGPLRPTVFATGKISRAGGVPSINFAAWACPTPPCYPDCNADGFLNLSDFGCFTTKFALADPYADCNADAVLNLSDFGCFTTKFALGCP